MWTWISDLFRSLLFLIDKLIYGLIEKVYNLFMEIANTTIFTNEMINEFAGKVYALVGIFMLFKVSFSILTYIINPDEFADKNKGMAKLVKNILTSLILLISVPFIFSEAMDIQRIVLRDDVIPKIFSTNDIHVSSQNPNQGSETALLIFQAFYDPPGEYQTLDQIFDTNVNAKDDNKDYVTEYSFIISSVVGVITVLIFISFCFDIAVRSVKLGFLRLLAPVPIIARVDPKKGNELFDKWTKTCVNTYLDLFMRLIAIFFSIYIINAMTEAKFVDAVTNEAITPSGFAMVFIILGVLLFAKQLPKLIEDLLGIKLSGSFTLNPMKKMASVPFAGNLAARGLGAVGSKISGEGFRAGWQAGGRAVSWKGDENKSILCGVNRFTEDGRKKYEERRQKRREHKYGEDLLNQAQTHGEDSIYKGRNAQEYAASVRNVEDAKNRRNTLQSDYEKLKMDYEANKDKMTEPERIKVRDAVDKARIAAVKADSDYDKVKKAHDYMRSQDSRNARIEDAYMAAKDASESIGRVQEYSQDSTNDETSSQSSSTSESYQQAYTSSDDKTEMQERVEQAANYHEAPTREEHNEQQDYYTRFFNDSAVSNAIDANEHYIDSQNNSNERNWHPDDNGGD